MENNNRPKFYVGQNVIYVNGNRYELGVVKDILFVNNKYLYRVWYHTGSTTATTDEDLLHTISNDYAFSILRKSADKHNIELCPARQKAARMLEGFRFYGDAYYRMEDWLTDFLEGNERPIPYGMDPEYLRMTLRAETEDYISMTHPDFKYTNQFIEECVDFMLDAISISVLNDDYIHDCIEECVETETLSKLHIDFEV